MKVEEYIKKIETELAKLRNIDNKQVKEVYTNVELILSDMKPVDKEVEKEEVEDKKEEEKPTTKDEKSEDKPEKETESEEKSEEPKEEVKEESKEVKEETNSKKELNLKVSEKLSEAAIELSKFEKDIKAKEEVIEAYKIQVTELSVELETYKEVERIELQAKFDIKVNTLIELYNNLGIKKESSEIKTNFNEEQIDKLTIDLSAMLPKKVETKTSAKRLTPVSVDLELSKHTKKSKKLSDADIAQTLFGIE